MESPASILVQGSLEPGTHFLFGVDGSLRWSEIWRVAGLLASVRVLRNSASKASISSTGVYLGRPAVWLNQFG